MIDMDYVLINGQVWARSQEPEGERWIRLNRTRKSPQTVRTWAQIERTANGSLVELAPVAQA